MTSKSKSPNTKTKSKKAPSKSQAAVLGSDAFDALLASVRGMVSQIDRRKELLAQVAGAVATGLVMAPSDSIATPRSLGTAAVEIAEAILEEAGIAPTAAPKAPNADDVAAA